MKAKLPSVLLFLLLIISLLFGCSDTEEVKIITNGSKELITRGKEEYLSIPIHTSLPPQQYPWDEYSNSKLPKITKEFFRCKGTRQNPEKTLERNGTLEKIADCEGGERHSLPLRDNKEYIYPILIHLLNHIQTTTQKRVVITSGHRCPEHNTFVDPTSSNNHSKHLIGAEVSFYVQGMENEPMKVLEILSDYYQLTMKDNEDFFPLKRYEMADTNVSTKPWFNKEIFIKLFKEEEGRNFDNRHPYPYIALQVRFDLEKNEKVICSWDKYQNNIFRR